MTGLEPCCLAGILDLLEDSGLAGIFDRSKDRVSKQNQIAAAPIATASQEASRPVDSTI
jgi:hypothetical protein